MQDQASEQGSFEDFSTERCMWDFEEDEMKARLLVYMQPFKELNWYRPAEGIAGGPRGLQIAI